MTQCDVLVPPLDAFHKTLRSKAATGTSVTHLSNEWLENRTHQLNDIKDALITATKLFPDPGHDTMQSMKVRLADGFIKLVKYFLDATSDEVRIPRNKGKFLNIVWNPYADA